MQQGTRENLEKMRKLGLDAEGVPISSYWKARIEAEEGRVLVKELTAEITTLRSNVTLVPSANVTGEFQSKLQELQALNQSFLNQSLEKERRTLEKKDEESRALILSGRISADSGVLRKNLTLANAIPKIDPQQEIRNATGKLQARLQELQHLNQSLKKEIQTLEKSRGSWKDKALALEARLSSMTTPSTIGTTVEPLGRVPSIQDLLSWLGVRIYDSAVLAAGVHSGNAIRIEVQGDSLIRAIDLPGGAKRIYKVVPLSAEVKELFTLFLPYSGYHGYRTDFGVVEAFKMLGRPLSMLP